MRELWRGRSAREGEAPPIPGSDKGLKRATAHLCLTRWDAAKPAHVDNLVRMRVCLSVCVRVCVCVCACAHACV